MIHTHRFKSSLHWIMAITFAFFPAIGWAKPMPSDSTPIQFRPPRPPSGAGSPRGRGQGGGYRGPECKRYEAITAIVPPDANQAIPWGQTTEAHPTLWLYAPQGLGADVPIEWMLEDPSGQMYDRTALQSTEISPGLFSVSMSTASKPLTVGTTYHGSVSIYCDPEAPDVPVVVDVSIQRVAIAPELQQQLDQTQDPVEQATIYAQNGFWYDAVNRLGISRRQGNEAATDAWAKLLQEVNLTEQATAAIESCCSD